MPTKSGPSPRSVKAVQIEPDRLRKKGFVKQMSFKSGVKGRASDRWWERRWGLWCVQDEVNQEESKQDKVYGNEVVCDNQQ